VDKPIIPDFFVRDFLTERRLPLCRPATSGAENFFAALAVSLFFVNEI
jgi:hypothetical protein